ncbi:MAG: putative molybdenum carrier protein [Longimicrobiaceae bacterium]
MKLVSGGQTGVDRAALDVALELGVACGGWCPAARRAEDGAIPERYPLQETPSSRPGQRTEWNVRDSNATLILCPDEPVPGSGTAYTVKMAKKHGRPYLLADPDDPAAVERVRDWLEEQRVNVLNLAGPRESQSPGIGARTREFLIGLLA